MRTMIAGTKCFLQDLTLDIIISAQILDFNSDGLRYKNLETDEEFYREKEEVKIISIIAGDENTILENKDLYSIQTDLIRAIISRDEVVKYSENNFKDIGINDKTVLVSITDPDREKLDKSITKQFTEVLEVQFWDIETEIGNYKPLSDKIAKTIKDFINNNKDKNFVIHCEAGMSRSAGVGMAVLLGITHNWDRYEFSISPNPIRAHRRYSPNLVVLDKIEKA